MKEIRLKRLEIIYDSHKEEVTTDIKNAILEYFKNKELFKDVFVDLNCNKKELYLFLKIEEQSIKKASILDEFTFIPKPSYEKQLKTLLITTDFKGNFIKATDIDENNKEIECKISSQYLNIIREVENFLQAILKEDIY